MNLYEIRSRTYFEISSDSGDYNKFVNALRCSPVQFFGLEIRKNVISGYVRTKDMKRLCSLAEAYRLDVTQSREHGAAVVLKKYKKRYGLVIGFMLSVGIIAFLNDRVMMIEIGGNETISDSRIISLLEDTGIKHRQQDIRH